MGSPSTVPSTDARAQTNSTCTYPFEASSILWFPSLFYLADRLWPVQQHKWSLSRCCAELDLRQPAGVPGYRIPERARGHRRRRLSRRLMGRSGSQVHGWSSVEVKSTSLVPCLPAWQELYRRCLWVRNTPSLQSCMHATATRLRLGPELASYIHDASTAMYPRHINGQPPSLIRTIAWLMHIGKSGPRS